MRVLWKQRVGKPSRARCGRYLHTPAAGHHCHPLRQAIRGLVRSEEKASACEALGIIPVRGTLADLDLLAEEARAADVVVNAASSDDRPAIDAIVDALRGSGKALVHTSGISIVADNAGGEPSNAIYDEDHLPPPTADKPARVELDRAILSEHDIRSIVLCNSLVYGDALGPSAQSVQLPLLIECGRKTDRVPYISNGLNRWSTVHIPTSWIYTFVRLMRHLPAPFLFVESGEASFRDMAISIADALHLERASSIPLDSAEAMWGRGRARYSLASNRSVRSLRSRSLGWTPTGPGVHQWIREYLS